jgi:hypothetical protein
VEVVRSGGLQPRLVDGMHPWIVNVLTALGFGIPTVIYFWVIARFGVNVLVNDQLTDVSAISGSKAHFLPWGVLWAQHTNNRMFFPRLLDIVLADTVHFDIRFEEFLSGTMLVAASALLIWAHKCRSPRTPWLYYCPLAFLSLSLVQYENTLWGFQVAWYLVLLALSVAIVLLDRVTLSTLALIGAVAAGVVGSYSLFQGLLIWPVGLLLLYHRRRSWQQFAAWIACGIGTVALYFVNFDTNASAPKHGYAIHHLLASVKFFLFALGDIAGVSVKVGASNTNVLHFGTVILFGTVIVALAVLVVICYGLRRDEHGGGPVGVALIVFGLLFAASITQGRILLGYHGASASRYRTFDLLVVMGIYLCVLGPPNVRMTRRRVPEAREVPAAPSDAVSLATAAGPYLRAVRWLVAAVVVLQIAVGEPGSAKPIRAANKSQLAAAQVSRHLDQSSDNRLRHFVAPWLSGQYIRLQLRTAEGLHISLYYGTSH